MDSSLPNSLWVPDCVSNSSLFSGIFTCATRSATISFSVAFTVTELLVLFPLYLLTLWVVLGGRRRPSSHSDVITYHMMAMEVVTIAGWLTFFASNFLCSLHLLEAGYYTLSITYPGQTFFHCLTCIEHYLAVARPITYLSLRKSSGVRNFAIGCVWLMSLFMAASTKVSFPKMPVVLFLVTLFLSLSIVTFCTFSTLCALIRRPPGEVGRAREWIDRSKRKAFHAILAIKATLVLRFCGLVTTSMMFSRLDDIGDSECVMLVFGFWLCLPSSFILPTLFLQRAGKLPCCGRN